LCGADAQRRQDGNVIAFNCNVVENEIADNMYQRFELDWLIGNASFEN